ncbi:MAG: hypothetical protein Q4F07_03760 [Bacteroidales bacterium]|nr:hypothetical protein [Bacteroidales bacterium]
MKKFIYVAMLALCVMATAGCSSKKEVTKLDDMQLLQKPRSQQLAEENADVRAWGEAIATYADDARAYAENQARGEFVRKLKTQVSTADRQSSMRVNKSKSDDEQTMKIDDSARTEERLTQTLAAIEVSGLVVINTDTYKQKNGQYRCYVCIEYRGDVAKLADDMARSYKKALNKEYGEDNISDEERIKIELRAEEFRKSVKDELDRMMGK